MLKTGKPFVNKKKKTYMKFYNIFLKGLMKGDLMKVFNGACLSATYQSLRYIFFTVEE